MNRKSIILYLSLIVIVIFIILYHNTPKITQIKINDINLVKNDQFLLTRIFPFAAQFERGTPIDRYYIEKFLKKNQKYIKGDVLEMENNNYTYKFGKDKVISASFMDLTNKKATIMHDLQDTKGLPANKFDCYICTQTLPYIYDIKAAFASAKKMLKKDGVFLVTAPGISQLSYKKGEFYEYWHFTDKTFVKLAKEAGFRKIKVSMHGNSLAATALLQGLAVEDLKTPILLDINDPMYPVTVTLVAIK